MANFSQDIINKVWEKGFSIEGYDAAKFRHDTCGAWMQKNKYGSEENLGWAIDHVYPLSKGGKNDLENLRPMNWQNNRSKADNYPSYQCAIKSNDNKNVKSDETRVIHESIQETLKVKYKIK